MPRVLILTTDLSYFLDDNGQNNLKLHYLTQHHEVSVLAPCHDSYSEQSVAKLEASPIKTYFWPRSVDGLSLLVSTNYQGELSPFLKHLPKRLKGWLLKRLLNIKAQPLEALKQLATLANCAPQLLSALSDGQWRAMVLIKVDSDLWLNYLPTSAAKLVFINPGITSSEEKNKSHLKIDAITQSNKKVTGLVDKVAFLSESGCQTDSQQLTEWVERAIHIKKKRPFKLLYDLRWMEIGSAGGIEQATYEMISAVSQLDRNNAYRIFAPRSTCTEWDFPKGFQVKCHYSDPVSSQLEVARSFLTNKLSEGLGMPPVLTRQMRSLAAYRKLDFDIVHSLCGYTRPDMLGFPGVLTINDLQHLHYPEFFTQEEYAEREKLYRESAERAEHIICISEFTRQDVHRQYDIPLEKMSTVWIIPSRNVWQPLTGIKRISLLAGMQLTSPFFFFPAHCWPHKNHARLVEAFSRIVLELPQGMQLVMTGRTFPADHPAAVFIRDNNLSSRIVHLGYRSPLEVRALFQGCLALVFPSLFEGYGMPVAEAIIAGKPVLCSNVTSLPELVGEAALTFDPNSVEEIANSLLAVATDSELRRWLTEASIRRRPLFSARLSAIQTLSIYQGVHDKFYSC
jgi:glycosyltransferase involved in cell wall biosynthesis